MNTNPRTNYSFSVGLSVVGRGLVTMAKEKPLVFVWVNIFSMWFLGGGALMLYWGSTSILPLVCVVTPFVAVLWLILVASKYGFSRLLGMPRVVPWLVAMMIAVMEYLNGGYESQPEGYFIFLSGFLVINGIATILDFVDIFRWSKGERSEVFETGFFSGAH